MCVCVSVRACVRACVCVCLDGHPSSYLCLDGHADVNMSVPVWTERRHHLLMCSPCLPVSGWTDVNSSPSSSPPDYVIYIHMAAPPALHDQLINVITNHVNHVCLSGPSAGEAGMNDRLVPTMNIHFVVILGYFMDMTASRFRQLKDCDCVVLFTV